jgi:hypothetical protein
MIQLFGRRQPFDADLSEEHLDKILASSNPITEADLKRHVHQGDMQELRNSISRTAFPSRSPRRVRGLVLMGAAAAIAVLAGAAGWGAHTGVFGKPGQTEADTSEWLRVNQPDIVPIVEGYTTKYQLPPGGSWKGVLGSYPVPNAPDRPKQLQATAVEFQVAEDAYCQWRGYWITGYRASDRSMMASAQEVLDEFPTWPITRKGSAPDAIVMWKQVAALAKAGDIANFQRLYALQCSTPDMQP